jgi:hypothetical protein
MFIITCVDAPTVLVIIPLTAIVKSSETVLAIAAVSAALLKYIVLPATDVSVVVGNVIEPTTKAVTEVVAEAPVGKLILTGTAIELVAVKPTIPEMFPTTGESLSS